MIPEKSHSKKPFNRKSNVPNICTSQAGFMLRIKSRIVHANLRIEEASNKRKKPLRKRIGKKRNGNRTSQASLDKMLPFRILFFREAATELKVFIASVLLGKEKRMIEKPSQ